MSATGMKGGLHADHKDLHVRADNSLEETLVQVQMELIRRSVSLLGEKDAESRTLLLNNIVIMEDLSRSIARARTSKRVADFMLPGR